MAPARQPMPPHAPPAPPQIPLATVQSTEPRSAPACPVVACRAELHIAAHAIPSDIACFASCVVCSNPQCSPLQHLQRLCLADARHSQCCRTASSNPAAVGRCIALHALHCQGAGLNPCLFSPGRQDCSTKPSCRHSTVIDFFSPQSTPTFLQNRDLMATRSPHSRSSRRPSARGLCLPESAAHLCTRGPSLHGCCQAAGQRGHGKELCHPAGPNEFSIHARSFLYCAGMEGLLRSGRSGLTIRGSSKGCVVTWQPALFPTITSRARGAGGATYRTSCFTHRAPPGRMHWRIVNISGICACCRQTPDFLGAVWGLGSSCCDSKDRQHARQRHLTAPSLVHNLLLPALLRHHTLLTESRTFSQHFLCYRTLCLL